MVFFTCCNRCRGHDSLSMSGTKFAVVDHYVWSGFENLFSLLNVRDACKCKSKGTSVAVRNERHRSMTRYEAYSDTLNRLNVTHECDRRIVRRTSYTFLPRCMECRRRLAMRILSVCPFVCPSNAWIVTKRKRNRADFYTIRKTISSSFLRKRMVSGGRPLLAEILCQPASVGAKSPILNR